MGEQWSVRPTERRLTALLLPLPLPDRAGHSMYKQRGQEVKSSVRKFEFSRRSPEACPQSIRPRPHQILLTLSTPKELDAVM